MVYTSLVISIAIAVLAIALGGAYISGSLDPLIQQLGVLFFEAKAEAEVKKLQAQGLQEGQDFVKGMSFFSVSGGVGVEVEWYGGQGEGEY